MKGRLAFRLMYHFRCQSGQGPGRGDGQQTEGTANGNCLWPSANEQPMWCLCRLNATGRSAGYFAYMEGLITLAKGVPKQTKRMALWKIFFGSASTQKCISAPTITISAAQFMILHYFHPLQRVMQFRQPSTGMMILLRL